MAGVFDTLPVWTIPPDWSNGVLERLEWLTDVLTSSSGAEQRSRLRLTPRRTLEMGITAQGPERTLYALQIKAAGASDWYVPLWHDIVRTTVAIVAGVTNDFGALSILLPTAGHEYAVGGLVILHDGIFAYEIAVIAAISADRITLTVPTSADWPVATRLMPLMRARLTAEPTGSHITDRVLTATVSFTGTRANPAAESLGDCPSYKGFPVLTVPPDESTSLAETYQRLTTVLDNKTGLTVLTDTAGFGFVGQQYRWYLRGIAEHAALRSLLYALHGRQTPLWLPTFAADLDLVRPAAAADSVIVVARCGYTDFPVAGRSEIMVALTDGTQLFASVLTGTVAGDTELLRLAGPLGRDLNLSSVRRISFMALARQDSDTIEIAHRTDSAGAASVATTFRESPDLRNPSWSAFNPDDSAHVDLTNFDLTVELHPFDNFPFVRTRHGKHTGKWYFEGSTGAIPGYQIENTYLGLCTLDAVYADMYPDALKGCLASHRHEGGFRVVACNVATDYGFDLGREFITAEPMCFAVDLDAKKFWFAPTAADAFFNGDPAAGTGGCDFSSLGDVVMYPCAIGDQISTEWTINLGSKPMRRFVIPAGFHAGWSVP